MAWNGRVNYNHINISGHRLITVLMVALLVGCSPIAESIDRSLNQVDSGAGGGTPPGSDAFHASLFIADLHADTLMWERDLLVRSDYGHVDLPRLQDGNVAIQVLMAVTVTPVEQRRAGSECEQFVAGDATNTTGWLSVVQGRPVATWFDWRARALYQAHRAEDVAMRSRSPEARAAHIPEMKIIRTVDDLREVVTARRNGRPVIGVVLGLEGVHWLGDPDLNDAEVDQGVRELFEAGFRLLALTHRFSNGLADSSEGEPRGGLTPRGRRVLADAASLGMVIDLAHISPQALTQATEALNGPVLVSHTGVQAGCVCPCHRHRNLSDADILAVARRDGVIGIGYWPEAVGPGIPHIVDAMEHVARVLRAAGFDPSRHIALGSDFDGAVTVPFDVSGLSQLTAEMRRAGSSFSEADIRRIAGLNVCRVLATRLPGGSAEAARQICGSLDSAAERRS